MARLKDERLGDCLVVRRRATFTNSSLSVPTRPTYSYPDPTSAPRAGDDPVSTTPDPASASPPRPRRKHGVLRDSLLLLGFILVVLGGVGAYLYWGVLRPVGAVEIPEQLRRGLSIADTLDEE